MRDGRSIGRAGTTLLILALLGASAGGAAAQERDTSRRVRPGFGQGMRGMGEWWNDPQMVERLGLDEGTREQIDHEVYRTKRDSIELSASVRTRLGKSGITFSSSRLRLASLSCLPSRLP